MATKQLNAVVTIGGTVTSGLKSVLGATKTQFADIGKAIREMASEEKKLGQSVRVLSQMGQGVDSLRQRYVATIQVVERLRAAQSRLATAQERSDRINARAGKMAGAGVGATVVGGALVASVVPGIKEAKHYETEQARIKALGMGEDTNKKAFAYAKQMKTFGTSNLENLELLRDGMSVFADLHHAEMVAPLMAKMKFGNKAVFGAERGGQNAAQFMDMLKVIETRGGLKSEAEFNKQANIIQQVISATGGRVGATEWRHMLATGGLAGKSMSSEALFYTMEHLVQEMGGDRAGTGLNSMYKSLYQGVAKKRSIVNLDKFGLIGDKSKVKHDKAGQVASIEPGALLGADLFRANPFEWMKKVLLPQLAKKGITEEKQVIDTIGMIVSNSVGGSFLAEMYRQRDNIDRAQKRNMGAQNIDQLATEGKGNAVGKELDAEAKLADIKLRLGEQILPMYTQALTTAANALETLNKFTADHPALAKVAIVTVTALGAGLVVLGPLLTVAAGGMTLYAAAQLRIAANAAAVAAGIGVETAAIRTQNSVVASSIAGFAKRALLVLGIANLADAAAGAMGVGKDKANQSQDDKNWDRFTVFGKAYSGTFRGIEKVGRILGATNIADQAQANRVKGETEYLASKSAPAMPPMATARGKAEPWQPFSQTNTFNLAQQPGQSSEQFARDVAKALERQNGVKQRGALTDTAGQ